MNKQKVLKYIKQKRSFTIYDIMDEFNYTSSKDFKSLNIYLNELEQSKTIFIDDTGRYSIDQVLEGIISIHQKGFGFVKISEEVEYHISNDKLHEACNRDKVSIRLLYANEAEVVDIIERGYHHLIGTIKITKKNCIFEPDDKTFPVTTIERKSNYVSGLKAKARIISYHPLKISIEEVIGHIDDPGVDILTFAYKYGVELDFNEEVLKQIENISQEIDPSDIKNRVDLRDLMIVSIDGETAKDLDDAISLRKLENGNYELGVHIADVSYYVTENSPLDKEALKRGTSIYLVDRVIPMLPHQLSNGICSLNEGVDRYTISCFMEIDHKGEVVNYRILPTVINNHHRMTYTNVNKIIDGDTQLIEEYQDAYELFLLMKELNNVLTKSRVKRGAIDFDTNEAIIDIDENGHAIDVRLRERGNSERYIESFMLIANETVARHFKWLDIPFIYRIHEIPKAKKLQQFLTIAKPLGYTLKGSINSVKPKQIANLMKQAKGKVEQPVISTLLLRSMQKARYSENCLGHFGLADEYYTHFTSPIRRYPDLMVHRLIRNYLFNENYSKVEHYEKIMPEISEQTSKCERIAIDLERDVDDMKKAEYMSNHIGEVYEGMISSITSFGMFIELDNTIEGLVHISELKDDYYYFVEDQLILVGKRTGKIYKISDKVKIRVTRVNKYEKQIDFEIISKKKERRKRYGRRRK